MKLPPSTHLMHWYTAVLYIHRVAGDQQRALDMAVPVLYFFYYCALLLYYIAAIWRIKLNSIRRATPVIITHYIKTLYVKKTASNLFSKGQKPHK